MAIFDPTTPDELWYPIPSLPGFQFSSDHRVRRPSRGLDTKRRPDQCSGGWFYFRGCNNFWGRYPAINFRSQGKMKFVYLHDIVAELAYGSKPPGMQVRHLDDYPQHCYASNLAYGTHRDNARDADRNESKKMAAVSEFGNHGVRCVGDRTG